MLIARNTASKLLTHREIAERHNVSVALVSRLSSQLKHNHETFVNRRKKELTRAQQQTAIIHVAQSLLKEHKSVWTVEQVQT